MANTNIIKIEITSDASGATKAIRMVGDETEKFGARSQSALQLLKGSWIGITAGATAAYLAINKAVDWADIGAKAQQAEESFRIASQNMGVDADRFLSHLERAAAGTVDSSDIMQRAVKGMVLGLSENQLVGIMETARLSARVAGEDVKTAYEDITNAIATGLPRALRRYGLISKEEMATVNQALKAGIENVDLYTVAMMNAGIQAERMGDLHENAAEKLQVFHAKVKEIRESVGKVEISVMQYLLAGMKGIDAFVVRGAQGLATILSILPGKIGQAGKEAQELLGYLSADLMRDRAALLGLKSDAERKETEAARVGAAERIAAAEKEKKEWLDRLKAQIAAAKEGKKHEEAVSKSFMKEYSARAEVLQDFYGDAAELSKIMAEEDIKGFEARKALEEKYQSDRLRIIMDADEQAREIAEKALMAEMGIGEALDFSYSAKSAFEAAEAYGDVANAIRFINEGLGEQQMKLEGAQSYIRSYVDLWAYANKTMEGYNADFINAVTNGFRRMEDALVNFAMTGKIKIQDFANSVIASFVRIAVQANITAPFAKWTLPLLGLNAPIPGMAGGGDVYGGFPYIVGERGPELFIPKASGAIIPKAGGGNVKVQIINESGTPMQVSKSTARVDLQEMVVTLWLDAVENNKFGIRTMLGR